MDNEILEGIGELVTMGTVRVMWVFFFKFFFLSVRCDE